MQLSNAQWQAVNAQVIEEFRANAGRCGGHLEGNPLILLTTTGAKTGRERVTPLTCVRDGERILVVASKAGAPVHPDWFHNLVARPEVGVEVEEQRFDARARVAAVSERERLFDHFVAHFPRFDEYRKLTTREIPVVILERAAS